MTKEQFFIIVFLKYMYDLYSLNPKGLGIAFTPENIINIAEQCNVKKSIIDKLKEWVNCEADRENLNLLSPEFEELAKKGDKCNELLHRIVKKYWNTIDAQKVKTLKHID